MRQLILLFGFVLLLAGCNDEPQQSQLATKKLVQEEPQKPTHTTPTFRHAGQLYAKSNTIIDIQPNKILKAGGNVKDILVTSDRLYTGTDGGLIDVFDLQSYELLEQIKIPSFHNKIYDQEVTSTVYSLDKFGDKIIIICSDTESSKSLYLYEKGQLKKIKAIDNSFAATKVRFVDENHVMLGLLSNEIVLYDLAKDKIVYRTNLSESYFSDMALSADKKKVVIGCESGIVYMVDVQTGLLKSVIQGGNKDKSFKVDISHDLVLSAGQDSLGIIYNLATDSYKSTKTNFLIYAGALSPDGSKAAFSFNEENALLIIDTKSNSRKSYLLSGQKSTLNAIIFRDNKHLVSASDDEYIMLWELP